MPMLDAIGLVVEDMGKSLDFFRLLGMKVPEDAASEGHVEVAVSEGFRLLLDTVEVIESFSTHEAPSGGRSTSLAFRCDSPADVDATFAAVVRAGHSSKLEPFDAFWGQRYATVLDPDGNLVDLYAPLE